MANRRCFQTLFRCLQSIKTLPSLSQALSPPSAHALNRTLTSTPPHCIFINNFHGCRPAAVLTRNLMRMKRTTRNTMRVKEKKKMRMKKRASFLSADKEKEAAEIGNKVIGPLQKSDRVFKPYEPVFAVFQIGSHQFKVSNRDTSYTERLKFCDVNDKLVLNNVLMLGSQTQTIIGRCSCSCCCGGAYAKVIIFKKRRRKNYRN